MNRYICIHCHCYQPPRENPWLGEVEVQDSAAPHHDWNERITAECYGPNTKAHILDGEGRIVNMINTYSRTSFNFGPTLLSWMERRAERVYAAVQEADRLSRERFGGHGSAIAQVYNHMIMPLATERDRKTQVAWGLKDFQHRFGRDPEGMWLPECAVDIPSLELFAENGIKFVILAQRQAKRSRSLDGQNGDWTDHQDSVDPTAAYRVHLPSGRTMAAFFHDAAISADMAFADLAVNGQALSERLMGAFSHERDWQQIVNVATDGETFGHHHKDGERSLAWCLDRLEKEPSVTLTNYAEYLARHEPAFEVELHENSSWSCVHGIERWRADCGCNSGGRPGWNQAWRGPLREAMDWLSDKADSVYTNMAAITLKDPDKARDAFIAVILDRSPVSVSAFLNEHSLNTPGDEQTVRLFRLMEMARMSQLIFTSCGWFFDEISGIEGVQVLQYAARCIQLIEDLTGQFLEPKFTELLAKAPSNVLQNGAEAYNRYAKGAKADLGQVAAHAGMSALFSERPGEYSLGSWRVSLDAPLILDHTGSGMACGTCAVTSELTLESRDFQFAALQLGGHQVLCGVGENGDREDLDAFRDKLAEAFARGDHSTALALMHGRFGEHTYSLARLFKDEQRAVLDKVMAPYRAEAVGMYRRVFRENRENLKFLSWLGSPLPPEIMDAGRHAVQYDLEELFSRETIDARGLGVAIARVKQWGFAVDTARLQGLASDWLARFAEEFEREPRDVQCLEDITLALDLCTQLGIPIHLWKAQNICFAVSREVYPAMKAVPGNEQWVEDFRKLCALLWVNPES